MLKQKIKELSDQYYDEIIAIRRHIHQNPELSFQEVETGKFISEKLTSWNIPHHHGIAENGIVGLIEGKNKGKVIALRADIDALPIFEANDVSYKSKVEGVMHACGHDVHTASLLGTVKILNDLKDEFDGTIKFLFQPGEELLPGGASIMIKEGVLENPKPDLIIGQHVHPPLQVGKIGMKGGMYMASADEIEVSVQGQGGHGALPQDCVDPVLMTAHILTALQQIVSRNSNPTTPCVLTFGKMFTVGGVRNVIPNEVRLEGTFRTMDEQWREEAHVKMKKMAEGMAESMGGKCEFIIKKGYPFLMNDEAMTEKALEYSKEFLGEAQVVDLPIRMTAEDFSYYSQEIPAVFYRLGTGNKAKGITSSVHTTTFDVDEDSLRLSTGTMAWMAISFLKNL